jgi:dihydroxyacetone kinase-like protein
MGSGEIDRMKKLINEAANAVRESLAGLASAHADLLAVRFDPTFVLRADAPVRGKVALVSGGGSGHEPLHAGYVGPGMLDAACPGDVFTSPTPDQIAAATQAVSGGAGVLHIVKNYTGDVLNFELAAELCQGQGIEVEAVVINDDVAVKDSLYTAGRRGVGGTVLAEKLCGAAAERGEPLAAVAALGRAVNANGRSMGVALSSCTVPAVGRPTFELGEQEMEIGIGIHGEPGAKRLPLKPVREIVEMMAEEIIGDLPFRRGDAVIALVNGMGATPLLELYIVAGELERVCAGKGIRITRRLVGNYITSLDMAGCSLTLLKLPKADERLLGLWDDRVHTPALRWGV